MILLIEVGLSWAFPMHISDLFEQWLGFGKGSKGKRFWGLWICSIWWSLWLERNNKIFENCAEPSYMAYRRAYDRCMALCCNDFVNWPILDLKASWVNIVKFSYTFFVVVGACCF